MTIQIIETNLLMSSLCFKVNKTAWTYSDDFCYSYIGFALAQRSLYDYLDDHNKKWVYPKMQLNMSKQANYIYFLAMLEYQVRETLWKNKWSYEPIFINNESRLYSTGTIKLLDMIIRNNQQRKSLHNGYTEDRDYSNERQKVSGQTTVLRNADIFLWLKRIAIAQN